VERAGLRRLWRDEWRGPIFLASRILSIDPIGGSGLELDAIAAVVIGGASPFGGRGSIIGTLLGGIVVFIRNGLNLLNVSPYRQGSAIGAIIVAAVLVERLLSGGRRSG
jgi:ribose transport system permease protein